MALQYRKKVRDAILALLDAQFNPTLNSIASVYGTVPFILNFQSDSTNFAVAHIDSKNVELSQLQIFPAACLYTTEAINTGGPKEYGFAGKVMAHLDFYVRDRGGAEAFNSEDLFDAIEDTAVTILQCNTNQWPSGVIYSRELEMGRETLIALGDGFATYIPIKALFEVYIQ